MAPRPPQVLLEATSREPVIVLRIQGRLEIQNVLAFKLRVLRLDHLLLFEKYGRAGSFKTLLLFCEHGSGLSEHDSRGNQ